MPYDDSDIKKMIKAQYEAKPRQQIKMYAKIDPLVKDLIFHLVAEMFSSVDTSPLFCVVGPCFYCKNTLFFFS